MATVYLTHGGGPLPLLGDPGHRALVASLRELASALPRPRAIVLVSAHWETAQPCLTGAANPSLMYDYYGFPEPAYSLRYPASGEPVLAERLASALTDAGMPTTVDPQRGFDHGMFVPLTLLYPDASVPVVQLSLMHSLDPAAHLAMGRALAPLLGDDVMLIGSGSSFHNMPVLMGRGDEAGLQANRQFEQWLASTCTDPTLSAAQREAALVDWRRAPGGAVSHPREEHLMPLMVCAGAAGRPADRIFQGAMGAVQVSSLLW
ncbi:extradiol ring-cleavage dioxygenase class III protein subunit B [Alcanivorax hongdengensis A-11-3]|uniref:Extradiol ring-cleavage dioxygenase class III protein subunit B n=1 Tax=Alcanivorax hongdengensis A-11-3 TaxID=1177179 RepID=L0WBP0_9GAMM|nr:class III extradiol ring-cleavage dioxygenase [Alcanivorax hongdengensis]EKF73507.1 extradiol ring-cleavage dioxygenase class III protein subunit B [Alcanivorax hongdengensis A-11-3]